MARGRRGRRGKRGEGKGLSRNADADFLGGEVTLGLEKGGIGVAVTFSKETMKVSLGIGVAAVEFDLGEPNNSKVSYVFDLYEIEGHRDGCTVTLEYRIAGVLAKTEVRKIPDCDDDRDQGKDDPKRPPKSPKEPPKVPPGGPRPDPNYDPKVPGDPNDTGVWLIGVDSNHYSLRNHYYGSWHYKISEKSEKRTRNGSIYIDSNNSFRAKVNITTERTVTIFSKSHSFEPEFTHRPEESGTYGGSGTSELDSIDFLGFDNKTGALYVRSAKNGSFLIAAVQWKIKAFLGKGAYYHSGPLGNNDLKDYGHSAFSKTSKLLDHFIKEKGLPTRKGVNGRQSDQTKKKRGNKKMDEKCCQMIAEIYDVLGVDEMIDEGFVIPKKWIAPEGKGNKRLDNYMQVLEHQMLQVDHYGIGPFKWKLKDANLVKKGDQSLEGQTINGTDAIREILQNTKKANVENETNLTAMGSLMIVLEQILQAVTEGTRIVREIFQFLGPPVKNETFKITLPFNTEVLIKRVPNPKKKKGNKDEPVVEVLNTTEKSDTLVPKMLSQNTREYNLEVYDDNYPNLIEQLTNNGVNNNAD